MIGRTEYAASSLPRHSDSPGHFPIMLMASLFSPRLLPLLHILCLPTRSQLVCKLRPSNPIAQSHFSWLVGVLPPRVSRCFSLHHRGVSWTSFDPLKTETAGSHPGSLPPKNGDVLDVGLGSRTGATLVTRTSRHIGSERPSTGEELDRRRVRGAAWSCNHRVRHEPSKLERTEKKTAK